jgi:DNA-binding SARP family transcriptional activator/tetratricopeptide (TPR) repeat protein
VEIRIFGPVEVVADGRTLAAGPPQQRLVIAALAIDAGRLVTTEALIDRVWDEAPPGARRTLYVLITRIRRLLEVASTAGSPARLLRRSGGYVLEVDPQRVDAHQFERLVTNAARAGSAAGQRVELLREALALWRGEPLIGLPGQWAAQLRQAWRQRHLDAVTAWADAELGAGNPAAAVGPLTELAAEHPFDESIAVTLLRVLSAVGRPTDALNHYARLRRRLADEIGTDPGPALQAAQQAILRGEPPPQAAAPQPAAPRPAAAQPAGSQPAAPQPAAPPSPVKPKPPANLPPDVADFSGREEELARLDTLAAGSATGPNTAMVISAVAGTAGVGKTALAVHWAHAARNRFPDGQLYVNLRGYDHDLPMSSADVLTLFLTALGVPAEDIPVDLTARVARYRTQVADRRMLILLDNAASVDQIRPLLPGTGSCAVLVTSRDSLAGLVAIDGARRLDLDVLPAPAAVDLLRRLIGARVDADRVAAARLAEQCARLPLALRIAAELAVSRPAVSLAELVDELSDQQQRLDLLTAADDPRAAVVPVFSWSVRHLPDGAARLFRLLGLHPGREVDAYAAAALASTDVATARRTLDLLARASLSQPASPGRYGMHDLLRAYGMSLTIAAGEVDGAIDRLCDYYLGAAAAAMNCLYPAEAHHRPRVEPPATPLPPLHDASAAIAWLDAERRCLVDLAAYTAARGRPDRTVVLASILYRYLDNGHAMDALTVHTHARTAATALGDRARLAEALFGLGTAYRHLARQDEAIAHLQQAVIEFDRAGAAVGQARALGNLAASEERLGRFPAAAEHLVHALALYRQTDDRTGEARALASLGIVECRQGRYGSAGDHLRNALRLFQACHDVDGEAGALSNLGDVEERLDRPERAAECYLRALALRQAIGVQDPWNLTSLGAVYTRLGDPDRATECHREALALFADAGDLDGQAWARNGIGEAACAGGLTAVAVDEHTRARQIATGTGARDQEARALAGLGRAAQAMGDTARARTYYEHALTAFTALGMPEAEQIRAQLAGRQLTG